jgi:hypothetical protein
MNIINFVALAVLGLLTLATFSLLSWAIYRNMSNGLRYRDSLVERLSKLRMSGLMEKMGVDSDRYLHALPVTQLEQHMKKCVSCPKQSHCDERLAACGDNIVVVDFCPNGPELKVEAERQKQAA